MIIKTILDSCVAVCLFDPIRKIGGMNHILLPGEADPKRFNSSARYGANAMKLLINHMLKLGAKHKSLVAKVFGGANVLPALAKNLRMGDKNSAYILDLLKVDGIRMIDGDLGGKDSRKIFFHTDTGEVLLQRIGTIQSKNDFLNQQKVQKPVTVL
jgi:chemotaxis protein CheD